MIRESKHKFKDMQLADHQSPASCIPNVFKFIPLRFLHATSKHNYNYSTHGQMSLDFRLNNFECIMVWHHVY